MEIMRGTWGRIVRLFPLPVIVSPHVTELGKVEYNTVILDVFVTVPDTVQKISCR